MPLPKPRPSLGLIAHPCSMDDLRKNQQRIMQLINEVHQAALPRFVTAWTTEDQAYWASKGYVVRDGSSNPSASGYTGANLVGRFLKLAAAPGNVAAVDGAVALADVASGLSDHTLAGTTVASLLSNHTIDDDDIVAAIDDHAPHKHYLAISGNDSDTPSAGTEDMNFPSVGGGTSGFWVTSDEIDGGTYTEGGTSSEPSESTVLTHSGSASDIDVPHSGTGSTALSHSGSGNASVSGAEPVGFAVVPMERLPLPGET